MGDKDSGRQGQNLLPQKVALPRAGPQEPPDTRSRLFRQRHFCVFAVSFPGQEALTAIYSTILSQHLAYRSASAVVQRMSGQLVASALGKRAPLLPGNPAALRG